MLVDTSLDAIRANKDAIVINTHDICNCSWFNQRLWVEKQVLAHFVNWQGVMQRLQHYLGNIFWVVYFRYALPFSFLFHVKEFDNHFPNVRLILEYFFLWFINIWKINKVISVTVRLRIRTTFRVVNALALFFLHFLNVTTTIFITQRYRQRQHIRLYYLRGHHWRSNFWWWDLQ